MLDLRETKIDRDAALKYWEKTDLRLRLAKVGLRE
jgi:hypothetical protein